MVNRPLLLVVIVLLGLFIGVTNAQTLPDYWPTESWRSDSAANHGFDEMALAAIEDYALREVLYLDSILIIRNGYIVYEKYFNNYDADTVHDIASVTKSWTSALVGIVLAQGALPDPDAPLSSLLPAYFADDTYADKRDITLRNLLMMRSGIEFDEATLDTGGYGTGQELLSQELTAFGLDFPMVYAPGTTWNYSTLDTQIISTIVQQAVGQPLHEYILPSLFEPMGIDDFEWVADASGTTIGGQQMNITPRDMAKLGLLYLHNGFWDGEQLVPADWVELSLTPQGEAFYPPTDQPEIIEWYGYLWWTWKPAWNYGYRAFQAKGYGGQQVLVLPELDLIIATTANLDAVTPEVAGQQEAGIDRLIVNEVFPALTDVALDYDIHIQR